MRHRLAHPGSPAQGSAYCTSRGTTAHSSSKSGNDCLHYVVINCNEIDDEVGFAKAFGEEFQHYFDHCDQNKCEGEIAGDCASLTCAELRGAVAAVDCSGKDFEACWKHVKELHWDEWMRDAGHVCRTEGKWTAGGGAMKILMKEGCRLDPASKLQEPLWPGIPAPITVPLPK